MHSVALEKAFQTMCLEFCDWSKSSNHYVTDADGGENTLKSMIMSRQTTRAQEMDTLFSSLEDKYCAKKPKTCKKTEASGNSKKRKHKK